MASLHDDLPPNKPGCIPIACGAWLMIFLGSFMTDTPMNLVGFVWGFGVIFGVYLPCKVIALAVKGATMQKEVVYVDRPVYVEKPKTAAAAPAPEDKRLELERAYKTKLQAIESLSCPDERRDAKTAAERDYLKAIAEL